MLFGSGEMTRVNVWLLFQARVTLKINRRLKRTLKYALLEVLYLVRNNNNDS